MESSLNRGNRMLEKVFEGKMVRTTIKDDGVWFVAKDVAKCLGYENDRKALKDHVDDEDKVYLGTEKLSNETLPSFNDINPKELGQRGGWLINESGMYALTFGSKLETAKKFKHWVTHDVLPSIRKNGFYVKDNLTPNQVARLQQTATNYTAVLKDNECLKRQVEMLDKKNDKLVELIVQTAFKKQRY